jgi:hypothetical protein
MEVVILSLNAELDLVVTHADSEPAFSKWTRNIFD